MTDQQKGVITLIKSALEGKAYTLPEGFDMDEAAKTALRHKIIGLVYYGAIYCGVDKASEPMKKLFPSLIATMNVVSRQHYALEKLYSQFEADGIDYMPMKGVLVQGLYPKSEMRSMGDADILVRAEQYDKVAATMQKSGFVLEEEGNHHDAWQSSKLHAEIHKSMLPDYAVEDYSHFADGWKLAKKCGEDTTRYALSYEDFFIFLFVHMTKHYRMSGVGIKHLVDLWVYKKAKPQLDEEYICKVMESMGLKTFYGYIMETVNTWFTGNAPSDRVDYITQVVFTSGEYGIAQSGNATRLLLDARKAGSVKKAKRKNFLTLAFPGLKRMRERYGILRKLPFLLPVFWVVRLVTVPFNRKEALRKLRAKNRDSTNEKVRQRQEALAFVGLEFKLEEKKK